MIIFLLSGVSACKSDTKMGVYRDGDRVVFHVVSKNTNVCLDALSVLDENGNPNWRIRSTTGCVRDVAYCETPKEFKADIDCMRMSAGKMYTVVAFGSNIEQTTFTA